VPKLRESAQHGRKGANRNQSEEIGLKARQSHRKEHIVPKIMEQLNKFAVSSALGGKVVEVQRNSRCTELPGIARNCPELPGIGVCNFEHPGNYFVPFWSFARNCPELPGIARNWPEAFFTQLGTNSKSLAPVTFLLILQDSPRFCRI
jgi:hypothetical protein